MNPDDPAIQLAVPVVLKRLIRPVVTEKNIHTGPILEITGQRRYNAGISGSGPDASPVSTVINPSYPGLLGSTRCTIDLR